MTDPTVLKRPLSEFALEKETTYGGAQRWFKQKRLQQSGCGVIACANLLSHLYYRGPAEYKPDQAEYMKLANRLKNFYIPILPGLGVNGVFLAIGMNLYFLTHRLPYRAFWGVSSRKRDERIAEMLANDIPVCLSIGPNFPNLFGQKRLTLYTRLGGHYAADTETKAHYVSVTAMDENWYEISTWGRKMYIKRREYEEYVRHSSCSLLSNVLVVKQTR